MYQISFGTGTDVDRMDYILRDVNNWYEIFFELETILQNTYISEMKNCILEKAKCSIDPSFTHAIHLYKQLCNHPTVLLLNII